MTATWSGLALTSAMPAGRSVLTATEVVPSSRSVTSRVARSVEPWSLSRSATEPPSVMRTRSVDVLYVRSERSPTRSSPTSYVRVAVTGRTAIVTRTVSTSRATTPVGSARVVSNVSFADSPPIDTGSVSMLTSGSSSSISPSTGDDPWRNRRRSNLEARGRVACDEQADREDLRVPVREHRDRHAGRGGLHADLADGVADRVDRHETHVLVDVDAGRLDLDVRARLHDAIQRRTPVPRSPPVPGRPSWPRARGRRARRPGRRAPGPCASRSRRG